MVKWQVQGKRLIGESHGGDEHEHFPVGNIRRFCMIGQGAIAFLTLTSSCPYPSPPVLNVLLC